MGKSKARIFRRGKNEQLPKLSRQEAVSDVVSDLESGNISEAKKLISIFGLSAEEILEGGASYEIVTSIKDVFK